MSGKVGIWIDRRKSVIVFASADRVATKTPPRTGTQIKGAIARERLSAGALAQKRDAERADRDRAYIHHKDPPVQPRS